MVFDLLHPVFATLSNITATIPIPVQITPTIGGAAPAATAANSIDLASIGTIGGAITAAAALLKSHFSNNTQTDRIKSILQGQQGTVNSVQASDEQSEQDAKALYTLTRKLCEDPNIAKLLNETTETDYGIDGQSVMGYIKTQYLGWKQSNKAYYHNTTLKQDDDDLSKDPILRQAAQIQKMTQPATTDT